MDSSELQNVPTPANAESIPPTPRVVLITGAAGGLGSALAAGFAAADWRVAAGWHHSHPQSTTPQVVSVHMDVTNRESCTAAVESVLGSWGRIDVLVNNAGIASDSLLLSMPEDDWQRVIDVNLRGAFFAAQAALRPMMRQRDGHILNIASYGGRVGRAGQVNYAASKAGLLGLTQSLAREVGSRNIRVNAILPGFLRTGMTGSLTEAELAVHAASNILGRLNEFDEVARAVVFIAAMRNVSGQLFQLDSRIAPWS